jgi:hypothetical protein
MPLPGGPTDKLGNRYELWWTVSQLVMMLHGKAESIRIEDPGVMKAEFVIVSLGRRELHQAKRSHQDGKWSLASLAAPDVQLLQGMLAELSGNDARFVFVSGSDARELAELADRAREAATLEEFELRFIDGKGQRANFDKLRKYWKNADTATAYEILRRIEVRTIDERSLEEKVRWGLRALFLADADAVCAELRRFAEDSIHQTITREALIAFLGQRGFRLRRLANPDNASALISEVTEQYLNITRRKLIRQSLIPRAETQKLLERLNGDTSGSASVLAGKAGAGKTGCILELVEALRARIVPIVVLAFRLDRLKPVSTTTELGQQLGFEESPALVLAAAAAGREAVLVVDQLDAVSTASGRSLDFLDAVEGLLAEARGLRDRVKLHVVVVCRSFDWDNDHRLRRLLSGKHAKVEVAEFSSEEVKTVLSAEGFRGDLFQQRQLELLGLPQNLSLFLDAGFDSTKAPQFNTAKELFDRYWEEKRRTVAERATPLPEQWTDVIQILCEEMTLTQELSVPREKLDRFAGDYLAQMSSEGVLTFDGQRYGFGHESFFDYCFARAFVAREQPLTQFLVLSEQHLFRRAQVRQVLAYLRDADRQRYCRELGVLLTDSRIRPHLKDLALALAINVPDPGDDEWRVLEPWLKSALNSLESGQKNEDKFASLVWQHFFTSASWFHIADRKGRIAGWLASGSESLANQGVHYLRFHQRHSGDRVAELLEPYAGRGGRWPQRLRYVMEWANHADSRRIFELFLRLIDDGTLDDARGPIAVNSTFWSMLHGLAKTRPEWVPEVIARWLRRRFALIRQQEIAEGGKPNWRDLFNNDEFAPKYFHEAASKAPAVFVENVLPVVLEITDAAIYNGKGTPPIPDAVWPIILISEHETINEACRSSLVAALEALARIDPTRLGDVVAQLRERNSYISNYLLLNLFTAGAEHFGEEAAALLCDQPWRFYCGFSDSPYWVAMRLIKAVTPICSPENRANLEAVILGYSPDYERTPEGRKLVGRACFALLSAIPREHRSDGAQERYEVLERKFGTPYGPPRGIHVYSVGSPIEKRAAEKMTDDQWLRAIAKYRSEERPHRWDNLEKGGAWELAVMLREFVQNEPERFALLCLQFPDGTNPVYIERTLEGLKGTSVPAELKLAVCRKAYSENHEECGKAVADLIGSIEEPIPDDAVQILEWLATEHPDPDKELWNEESTAGKPYYGGDILTHGINTTRGRAAEAIRDIILRDDANVARFRIALKSLVSDKSISVRSCAASILLAIAQIDWRLSLEHFRKLTEPQNRNLALFLHLREKLGWFGWPFSLILRSFDKRLGKRLRNDDRLLITHYVERLISRGLRQQFPHLRHYVERMLRSNEPKVSEGGARLGSLAALYHEEAADLVKEAMSGTRSQRLGVAQVASANIAVAECRVWCQNHLLALFNDDDPEVRRESASCFRHLKSEPLETYEKLISAFCDSKAYQEDSSSIFHALEDSVHRLPGITCVVCEKFLARFGDEAKDIRTHRAADIYIVVKMIFRTYHQHQRDEWAPRCLDLIDRMCLEGIHDNRRELDEYER